MFDAAVVLNHDRQAAPVSTARACCHALNHFFLQHEVHVANQIGIFQQMKNQRRGDVVGQVADYAQRAGRGVEAFEVKLQGIALMQREVAHARELLVEDWNQVFVEFNNIQLAAAVQNTFGQGTLARADFQQAITRFGVDGTQNAVNYACIVQEVLTKALARFVLELLSHKRVSDIW